MIQKVAFVPLEVSSSTIEMMKWLNQLKKDSLFKEMNTNIVKNNTEQYSLTPTHTMLTFPVSLQYKVYLIVTMDRSIQEQILEYGIGTYLPYQKNVIINEDIQQLQPKSFYYFSPIESFWKYDLGKEIVYIEGSTGEWLPDLNEQKIKNIVPTVLTFQETLTNAFQNRNLSFNPNDDLSWLSNHSQNEGIIDLSQIKSLLQANQRLMFVGSKYNNQVNFAYPIIGYHLWNQNQLYLAIYDDELDLVRYISIKDLLKYGQVIPIH